jgi:hypothetical protein
MSFGPRHYVPCLRWKQGEYKAVSLLSAFARELITPLIEVPEKGYDFETRTDKKTIDEHLAPFAKRVAVNWQKRPCFVDVNLIQANERMRGGIHPVKYIFEQLNAHGCLAIPGTGLTRDTHYQRAVTQTAAKDKRGLCIRLSLELATNPNLKSAIGELLGKSISVDECDLILDLGAPPNFVPLEGFAMVVESLIKEIPFLAKWRSFTMIGSSFPPTMGEIRTSPVTIPRNEWLLYKLLLPRLRKAKIRIPAFGDYVINHPDVQQLDMRLLKPSGTIRYAIDDAWLIVKGPNVRDNGYGQYLGHCQKVRTSSHYLGPDFSDGDGYIAECADGKASTGNLSTWRWVGTNHHLEKVARDVANFSSALGSS